MKKLLLIALLCLVPVFAAHAFWHGIANPALAPSNSSPPTISGNPQVSNPLTATTGTWTNSPTGYTYQWEWFDTTTNISGATSSTYTLVSGDIGHTIAVIVTASNAVGNSSPSTSSATAAVTAPGCAFGSALSDGCPGAQANGFLPYPNLMTPGVLISVSVVTGSGYTPGAYSWTGTGGGCSPEPSGTVTVSAGGNLGGPTGQLYTMANAGAGCTSRPTIAVPAGAGAGTKGQMVANVHQATPHNASTTWNMPGVDYPVGYDTTLTLKDPTSGGLLPSGATFSGHTVTISSSNVTLNGFDFCLHSTLLSVANSLTNVLISNNSFCSNANGASNFIINIGSSSSLTFKYNNINGLAPPGSNGSGFNINDFIQGSGSDLTFEYNYCFNVDAKCMQLSSRSGGTTMIEKFNLFDTLGNCTGGCSHAETEYTFSSVSNQITITNEFNTYVNWFHCSTSAPAGNCPNGNGDAVAANAAVQADEIIINGTSLDHDVIWGLGPGGTCSTSNDAYVSSANVYNGQQEGGTLENFSFTANYLDNSGTFFPWYNDGGSYTKSGNIDSGAGGTCN